MGYPLDPHPWRWDWIAQIRQLFVDLCSGPAHCSKVSMNLDLRARGCVPLELTEVQLRCILRASETAPCCSWVSRIMPIVRELSNLPRRPLWEDALQDIIETSPGVRLWRFLTVIAALLA